MEKNAVLTKKPRRTDLELLRILAAFFVIFNHTGGRGYFLFAHRPFGSGSFWVYLVFPLICGISVPLFFMISGALLLPRQEASLSRLWRKRIARIAGVLVLFMTLHEGMDLFLYGDPFEWGKLLRAILSGDFEGTRLWSGYLWYLYAYLAFLMGLPFLQAMVRQLKDVYFVYLGCLALVLSVLAPVLSWFAGVPLAGDVSGLWLVQNLVLYPCLGYYLEKRLPEKRGEKALLPLWIAVLAGLVVTCLLTALKGRAEGGFREGEPQIFQDMFLLVNCAAVWLTVRWLCAHVRLPQWLNRGILSLGSCTFGIYLTHYLVMKTPVMTEVYLFLTGTGLNSMVSCLIQCAAVMAACWLLTLILKKLPVLKNLLG